MFNSVHEVILIFFRGIETSIVSIFDIIKKQRASNVNSMSSAFVLLRAITHALLPLTIKQYGVPNIPNSANPPKAYQLNKTLRNTTLPYTYQGVESIATNQFCGKKALIVESDLIHRAFLCKQLCLARYQCFVVDRSNIVATHTRKLFDLIFVELLLPDDQEIIEIIDQILSKNKLLEHYTSIIGVVNKNNENQSFLTLQYMIKDFIASAKISDCLIRTYSSKQFFETLFNNIIIKQNVYSTQEQSANNSSSIYFVNSKNSMMQNQASLRKKVTFNMIPQESKKIDKMVNKFNPLRNKCIIF